jgi:hypothetical protein
MRKAISRAFSASGIRHLAVLINTNPQIKNYDTF